MDFLPIFTKMVELFLIIIIGYVSTKLGVITKEIKAGLAKLILNIAIPCTIISSVANSEHIPSGKQIITLLLVSGSSYIVLFILSKITALIMGARGIQKGAVEFGIMFSNVGFIGFPVTQAIFGTEALLYTTMFNMPFNLLCYSLGVSMLNGKNLTETNKEINWKHTMKLIFTPAMVSSLVAVIMALTKFQGPAMIGDTLEMVGNITTPGALLVIGSSLSEIPVKAMFNNVRAYVFTLMSVVVTPLVMYCIYRPFTASDPMLLGVCVIISAMPVATAGTMLCVEYGGDERFMAQITFLTTLASVVTIPLMALIL